MERFNNADENFKLEDFDPKNKHRNKKVSKYTRRTDEFTLCLIWE